MKMSDSGYLSALLKEKKIRLKELEIQRRVDTAVYNSKQEALNKDIDAIERQLEK